MIDDARERHMSTTTTIEHSIDASVLAGVTATVEVGLRLAAPSGSAAVLAKSLASVVDSFESVPVRIAGISGDHDRMVITLGVTLGTVDDIKSTAPAATAAVELIATIVETLAGYDPAFTLLPDPQSAQAQLAARVLRDSARADQSSAAGLLALIG